MQKSDILSNLQKGIKKVRKPKFNDTKYKTVWMATLRPLFQEVFLNE
jgi:hypothetical protein